MKEIKPSSADIPSFSRSYPLPPVSRIEHQEKYRLLGVTEALMEIPGDMAYQEEAMAYIKRDLDKAKAMKEMIELQIYVESRGLVADKNAKAKLDAGLTMDEEIFAIELDLRLAQSAYNFLGSLSLSLRKLYPENDSFTSKSFRV